MIAPLTDNWKGPTLYTVNKNIYIIYIYLHTAIQQILLNTSREIFHPFLVLAPGRQEIHEAFQESKAVKNFAASKMGGKGGYLEDHPS